MPDLSVLYSPAPYHIIRSVHFPSPLSFKPKLSPTNPDRALCLVAMAPFSAAPSTNPSSTA